MRTLSRLLLSTVLLISLAGAQNANAPGNAPQTASTTKKSPSKAVTVSPNGVATGWRAIHNSALIIDTHADTPGRFVDENFDLSQDAGTGYLDFNKIKAGNLGAEFFSIWVEPKANKGHESQARARHDRLGLRAGAPSSRQDDDGLQHAGHPRRPSPAQIGRAVGRRGRARHRGRHAHPARLLPPGRALHDADLVEHQRTGRLQRRS